MSRVATAAVVAVVAYFCVLVFTDSFQGTTVAYGKVSEAVRDVPWMHIQYAKCALDDLGNERSGQSTPDTEIWYSFNQKVVIQKSPGGSIVYRDYAHQQVYTYNPVSKRVVVNTFSGTGWSEKADLPWAWVDRKAQSWMPSGGRVTAREGQYNGQEVEVFDLIAAATPGVAAIRGTIFVDKETFLPIADKRTYIDPSTGAPQLIWTGTFDYPEQGPSDIYALGLSEDIPMINSLPLPPWEEIRQEYEAHRETIPAMAYTAVVTREIATMGDLGRPVESVRVWYTDGLHFRQEEHFVFRPGRVGVQWREQRAKLGNTFDSILQWSRACEAYGQISIHIFDGNRTRGCRRDEGGSWQATEHVFETGALTGEDLWNLCGIRAFAWPDIEGPADVIQDDYARANNLIRVEGQGGVFYLNPDLDYMCQRRVSPDGQVADIAEFGQTDDGWWYPARIVSPTLSNRIFFRTNPSFPEGIFDPRNLPQADR